MKIPSQQTNAIYAIPSNTLQKSVNPPVTDVANQDTQTGTAPAPNRMKGEGCLIFRENRSWFADKRGGGDKTPQHACTIRPGETF